jgi:hypothetical protein
MNQDKIKALAMELYKNEEVAIELANIIFGIRDGDYDEQEVGTKEEAIIKVCELLNNDAYSLDGE